MVYRLIPARTDDQAWLERLRRAVYQELFVATWGAWDEPRHLRHCAECWARGEILVVEVDGLRVGMMQVFEQPDRLEVGEIQIDPAYQSRGIGTRLLRDTIARAHAEHKNVALSVGLKNRRAFALYERLGFRLVRETQTHHFMACEAPS